MKLYLGLLDSSRPDQTRIFGEADGKFVDLNLAYAACLKQSKSNQANIYELASFALPESIAAFLEHGETSRKALGEVAEFVRKHGTRDPRGPSGERVCYDAKEIRLLPPLLNPEKSFVIGFSDKARTEALPRAEIPTGYYKLPQTFVTSGAPIVWPKFSEEVDADACLAIVVGKAGVRIPAEKAWDHVAGVTLVIDITARDINKREGLTTNNLLGKNFPSSTCIGPALVLPTSREEIERIEVELCLDDAVKQKFALRDCVFTVEQIIARWSILGIKPGDWFAIGASMALAGDRLQNPVALRIGSTIRCSSTAIGELSHQLVAAGGVRRRSS
ncbi:MAG TPA: fumarylacetoacetate hydrolase family protein [Terriglobales bacterium]|jgi:2-keto-4-pentenoate hydratase/2-oxohepta-3-ene-1,7-dioic acid hydratase in catechol pathway|nr:fumarylacetoacetate hydrolase family protein [Terriglobales bacterium]